jgi:hypothetical protein
MSQLFPFQDYFYIATVFYLACTICYRFLFGSESALKIPTAFYAEMSRAYFRMAFFVMIAFAALNFAILWTKA